MQHLLERRAVIIESAILLQTCGLSATCQVWTCRNSLYMGASLCSRCNYTPNKTERHMHISHHEKKINDWTYNSHVSQGHIIVMCYVINVEVEGE